MPFVNLENRISDEEFYKVCTEELANIPSYPISDEEKWNLKCVIYDTVIRYEEGKETSAELKKSTEQIGKSLDNLGKSFSAMGEYMGKIITGVAGLAETSLEISAKIKETKELQKKAIETAYGCRDNMKEALGYLDDAQDRLDETRKGIKKLEKNVRKIGEEAEEIKKGYEGKLAAKDAIIEIGKGMKGQGKNSGEGDYIPEQNK
jgi:DNA repair ATPase RecN